MIRGSLIISAILAVPVLLLLSSVGNASAAKQRSHKIAGEVSGVSVPDQTIVIKSTGKKRAAEVTLSVDAESQFLSGKERKSLADVHVGDRVKGKYLDKDGKHLARTVYLSSMQAPEKKGSDTKEISPSAAPAPSQPVIPNK